MIKISLLLSILLICSNCAVASLATATVKTTAAIITLPIKAAGAAVEAITPDAEDEENDEVEDDE
ncbi:hypothetical protein N8791_05155 [Gammaproteobacteria bacterium]|nr:hypothetical protein [Gammaproteobacteria bacterium]